MGEFPDLQVRTILAVLESPAGRAAIRAGVRAEWASFAAWLHNDGNIFMASKIRQWLAAPREPAQDEPAAGARSEPRVDKAVAWDDVIASVATNVTRQKALVDARAAGFAEGVEAAAKLVDIYANQLDTQGPCGKYEARGVRVLTQRIRALTPPAAPDALLPGLRAAEAEYERLCADPGLSLYACATRLVEWIKAEIARRGGA